MAGTFITLLLSGLLVAAPGEGGFTFEGLKASARTEQPDGFFTQGTLPFTDLAERGFGEASLDVEDRVSLPGATFGDRARLDARFRIGGVDYRVELTQAGFPPRQTLAQAPAFALPKPPPHVIEGGVMLGRAVYGDSGVGWRATTRAHAAIAVWGVGSVWRNGRLLTDAAFVHAAALDAGIFADDDTHRIQRQARPGDTELLILVWNLPPEAEPRGFLQFGFDRVAITVGGTPVRSVAFVDVTGEPPVSLAELTPVAPGAFPGGSPLPPPLPLAQQAQAAASATGGAGTLAGTTAPDVISGTFLPVEAPNPPANISGQLPGTPDPGSLEQVQGFVSPSAPAPGAPAFTGSAPSAFQTPPTPALVTLGGFTVLPVSPPNFDAFVGTSQVSPGLLSTVTPLGQDTSVSTPPLLGAPAPLNAAPPPPLLGTPSPLNASPAPALPATPAPPGPAGTAPVTPSP
ncbi:hypothetical protein KRR26_21905 [Corallococcus sp. M34]|uniref:hypothetical protein n=1 Tax=Citreicoccus inhibens TaxID=2849499 RepID=UPI001C250368|nr:hypothetical protein [Citreicoccus inhibens]MBU8898269.1 hypothetical protein [Citreicoccus inhibens]